MSIPPEVFYGIGTLVLLGALVWGVLYTRRRNRANDAITEKATHEIYTRPESYEREREELKKDIRPS